MLKWLTKHLVVASVLALVVAFLAMVLTVDTLNIDLYGRLIEVKPAKGVFDPKNGDPTITLVLHRILADEDAIDASLILQMDRAKFDEFKKEGNQYVRATVVDASFQPYGIGQSVQFDLVSPDEAPDPGINIISRESPRFELPISPSISGFPFDDVSVRFDTKLQGTQVLVYAHFINVEKQTPGRILTTTIDGGVPLALLTRTGTEKFLTLTSGVIFFLLVILVAVQLLVSPPLGSVASILTFAGFLMGTAGFRTVLGISRATGGSAFEVFTFEIPFIVLAYALLASSLRGRFAARKPSDDVPL